jgi:hypothetical protein
MKGTAVFDEPVVIIDVDHGDVRLKTGRIVSDGSSHAQVDNQDRTVVAARPKTRTATKALDEESEREFRVNDIHLVKAQEAEALRDPAGAQEWFGSVYQDWVVAKIQRAFKRLKM